MPAIPEQDVRHVAKLARLRLSDAEVTQYAAQLGNILDYVKMLESLNVSGVLPLAHALDQTNILRDDDAIAGMPVAEALSNAPDRDGDFFAVPKVLGDGGGA